jgi:hypothetical protein
MSVFLSCRLFSCHPVRPSNGLSDFLQSVVCSHLSVKVPHTDSILHFAVLPTNISACHPVSPSIGLSVFLPVCRLLPPTYSVLPFAVPPTNISACHPVSPSIGLSSAPISMLKSLLHLAFCCPANQYFCLSSFKSVYWSVVCSHLSVTVPPTCLVCCCPTFSMY